METYNLVFSEKAFDKAFQLEDNVETTENHGENEQTTTTLIDGNNKKSYNNRSNAVLTAVEPLSLPSVVGSKALFGNSNNIEGAGKVQGN